MGIEIRSVPFACIVSTSQWIQIIRQCDGDGDGGGIECTCKAMMLPASLTVETSCPSTVNFASELCAGLAFFS